MTQTTSPGQTGCAGVVALVGDYLDNTLPAIVGARVRQHLHGCGGCRALIGDYQLTQALCRRAGDDLPPPSSATSTRADVAPKPQGALNHGP